MLKLIAFLLAAAACVTAGLELNHVAEGGAGMLSTLERWQAGHPESLAWIREASRTHLHDGVWDMFAGTVLAWPPFAVLAGLAAVLGLLSRLSAGSRIPSVGGVRSLARTAGLALSGGALLLLGAGAWSESGTQYSVEAVWRLLHPASLEQLALPSLLDGLLEWQAWLLMMGLGVLLLLVRQYPPLPRGAPTIVVQAAPAAPPERRVPANMKRTLEYLESLRGSRPSA